MGRFVQGIASAVFIFWLAEFALDVEQARLPSFNSRRRRISLLPVSTSAVSISQGGASAPVSFSIIAHRGFNANVPVTFSGLPVGVTSNPANPFTKTPGGDTVVNFGAAATASTGSFTVSAEGVSGN